jgi:hypothetical protein
MRASFRALGALTALLCALPARSLPSSKSTVFSTVRGPVDTQESPKTQAAWPGSFTVVPALVAADLEVKVWRVGKVFNLEPVIDMREVNQSILPVDETGKVSAEASRVREAPWIKVTLPGRPTKTLDARCVDKEKTCRGLWPAFPFDPKKEMKLAVEVNLRGLEGKRWSLYLNRFQPERQISSGDDSAKRMNGVHASPGVATAPLDLRLIWDAGVVAGMLQRVEEWSFPGDGKLAGVGFHKGPLRTVYEILEGGAVVDILYERGIEAVELAPGDRLQLPPDTVHALRANKARLRRLDFH